MAESPLTVDELALTATHVTVPGLLTTGRDRPAESGGLTLPDQHFANVGEYQIIRLLGRGGMGVVYEAFETALGRRVAIKILQPDLAANPAAKALFLQEARAAAAVRSDHVVTIYSVGEENGLPYLSMELLTGTTLENYLRAGQCGPADVLRIGREVAIGLAAVHAVGLVHRDIKPDNIWIEAVTGRVKLLDFGLVQTVSRPLGDGQTSEFAGTPLYASPEQVQGRPVEPRSDLFSLGAVLYRAVAGRSPFASATIAETLKAIGLCRPTPVNVVNPAVPESLAALIHSLLAARPEDRPTSAGAVAETCLSASSVLAMSTIRAVVKQSDGPWRAATATESRELGAVVVAPPPRPARGRALAAVAAAAAFTVVGAVVLYSLLKLPAAKSDPPPRTVAAAPKPEAAPGPAPPKKKDDFQPLFAPNVLLPWTPFPGQKTTRWSIAGGLLACTAEPPGDQVLYSDATYTNFELEFEYRWLTDGGHTTLLLRAIPSATHDDALLLNFGDDEGFQKVWKRQIGALYRTGTVQKIPETSKLANNAIREWNRVSVKLVNQKLSVVMNDRPVNTIDFDKHLNLLPKLPQIGRLSGKLGFMAHLKDAEYRNIRLKQLP